MVKERKLGNSARLFLIDGSFNGFYHSGTHGIGDLFYPISEDTSNLLLNMKVLGFLAFY